MLNPMELWHEASRSRKVGLAAAGVVLWLVVAQGIALLLVGGNPTPDPQRAAARLEPLGISGVLPAPDAEPEKLTEPRGMGSKEAGLALLGVSRVDQVRTPAGLRRATEGSTLLAFRVGDWPCEVDPCGSWRTLLPWVELDGGRVDLPEGDDDTYVVVLPPGTGEVDLKIDADGFKQSLSLVAGGSDGANIALLAEPDPTRRIELQQRFRVAERTSIQFQDPSGQLTDSFVREFTVDYAQRRFFLDRETPAGPRRTFLIVNVYYSYQGRDQNYVPLDEVRFVDRNGNSYPARDLDPRDSVAMVGFEIPAGVRRGSLVVGGDTDKVAANGVSYVSRLGDFQVPIDLR